MRLKTMIMKIGRRGLAWLVAGKTAAGENSRSAAKG
jgi:hypothetical protein